ncbi:MAG: Fic family protein [Candidatus Zixiibacteriota bacterium]
MRRKRQSPAKVERRGWIGICHFRASHTWRRTGKVTTEVTMEVTTEVKQVLKTIQGEMSRREFQLALGLKNDEHFRKAYLLPALGEGLIEMSIPEKPRSSKQKYRLTEKGRRLVTQIVENSK